VKKILFILGMFLSLNAYAEKLSCSFEFAPSFFYSVMLDTTTLQFSMSAPRMHWRGFASSYSNPEVTEYYIPFGDRQLIYRPKGEVCLNSVCYRCL
jgi:hypothetical protein